MSLHKYPKYRKNPDNGGGLEVMQEINAEYDRLFKALTDMLESCTDNASDNMNHSGSAYSRNMYGWENDKALRDIL